MLQSQGEGQFACALFLSRRGGPLHRPEGQDGTASKKFHFHPPR